MHDSSRRHPVDQVYANYVLGKDFQNSNLYFTQNHF